MNRSINRNELRRTGQYRFGFSQAQSFALGDLLINVLTACGKSQQVRQELILVLLFHSGCRLPRADERLVSQPNECNLLSEISERGYVHVAVSE